MFWKESVLFTALNEIGTLLLAAAVTAAVLSRPRRFPVPIVAVVVILIFLPILARAGTGTGGIVAAAGAAAVAAAAAGISSVRGRRS